MKKLHLGQRYTNMLVSHIELSLSDVFLHVCAQLNVCSVGQKKNLFFVQLHVVIDTLKAVMILTSTSARCPLFCNSVRLLYQTIFFFLIFKYHPS